MKTWTKALNKKSIFLRILFLATISLSSIFNLNAQNVVYVNHAATGANDGTSWTDAYTDLKVAMDNTTAGEIWVAQGVYKPTNDGNRDISFELKENIELYGGFVGTETARSQRDYENNPTILSGDLNDDDVVNFALDYENIISNNSENSVHVINYLGNDNSAAIDGLIIQGGFADKDGPNVLNTNRTGAGLLSFGGNPKISNCIFQFNRSIESGGAIYLVSQISTSIQNCTFIGNIAYSQSLVAPTGNEQGGAIRIISSGEISNCTFIDNVSEVDGGAVSSNGSNLTINNCDFSDNFSKNGGAIYNNNNTEIMDCTFQNNMALNGAALYYTSSVNYSISNSEFINNIAVQGGAIFSSSSDGEVTNCFFGLNGDFAITATGNSTMEIENSQIADNVIDIESSTFTMINTHCRNVSIFNSGGSTALIKSSVFEQGQLGAIFNEATLDVQSSLFVDIQGITGAVESDADGFDVSFQNCTFYNNEAVVSGGGAITVLSGSIDMINCITWNNGSTSISYPAGMLSARNSIIQGGYPETCTNCPGGDGSSDPLFRNTADPDGPDNIYGTSDDGIGLKSFSPGVNAGDPTVTAPLNDVAGLPRVGVFDIGAYEYTDCSLEFTVEIEADPCINGSGGTIIVNPVCVACTGTVQYSFNNAVWLNDSILSNVEGGNYTVYARDMLNPSCNFSLAVSVPSTNMDNEPPVFTSFQADITVGTDPGECGAIVNYALPSAIDNCQFVEVDVGVTSLEDPVYLPGSLFPIGESNVLIQAIDFDENRTYQSFTVTVLDDQAPFITSEGNKFLPYDENCEFIMPNFLDSLSISENCPGNLIYNQSPLPGTVYSGPAFQNVPVYITVTDGAGNVSDEESFVIQLFNSSVPIAKCKDVTVYLDAGGFVPINFADIDDGSTWACGGTPAIEISPDLGDCFSAGTAITATMSITVEAQTGSCTSQVTIADNLPPVFDMCPSSVLLFPSNSPQAFDASALGISAMDNCTSGLTYTFDPPTYNCGNLPTEVTVTSTDASGNTGYCVIDVVYEDYENPVAVCQNVTVHLNQQAKGIVDPIAIGSLSSDDCGIVNMVVTQPEIGCSNIGSVIPVTLTVYDGGNNSASCTANVTIQDGLHSNNRMVLNSQNNGAGSLRQLELDACPDDMINFSSSIIGDTIFFVGSRINLDHRNLTINGPGIDQLYLSGNFDSRIFRLTSTSQATIKNLTMIDGYVNSTAGGAIDNAGGVLTLENVKFSNNYGYSVSRAISNRLGGQIITKGEVIIEE